MRKTFAFILSMIILLPLAACGRTTDDNISKSEPSGTPKIETALDSEGVADNDEPEPSESKNEENNMTNISITVGSSVFMAKLYDNDASKALLALFPITLDMSELNGNEKYDYLPDRLPSDSQRIGSINTGDLMLYGSDCLVLFYKSCSSSYSYTKLGYIEDTSSLAGVLGSSSVEVTFAVSD